MTKRNKVLEKEGLYINFGPNDPYYRFSMYIGPQSPVSYVNSTDAPIYFIEKDTLHALVKRQLVLEEIERKDKKAKTRKAFFKKIALFFKSIFIRK